MTDNRIKLSDEEIEQCMNMSGSQRDESIFENYCSSSEVDNSDADIDYIPPSVSSSSEENFIEDLPALQPENEAGAGVTAAANNAFHRPTEDDDWDDVDVEPPYFPFNEDSGLKIDLTDSTLKKLVELFFSDEFLGLLAEQTNLYASQEIEKTGPVRRSCRMANWKATDVQEMKVFLALLLHMGPFSLPTIEHYWNSNVLYNITFWSSVMSRNRFQMLLRFFHFSDNSVDSNDVLYKIRPILDHFHKVMEEIYVPGRKLSIDESMLPWRGRLFFRQYIKNKKHKYGVKIYELCESNGLIIKIKVYCGQSENHDRRLGHAADVVLNLMQDYLDKGYILHMDNFYNSVALTDLLTDRKTYVCGTLRKDRRGNPKCVVNRKLKKGEVIWKQRRSVVVCKWKDKREVFTISNMHKFEMVDVHSRNGRVSKKPNIVKDCNSGMSGIDLAD